MDEIGKSIQADVQLIPIIDFKPIRGLFAPLAENWVKKLSKDQQYLLHACLIV